MRATTHHRDAIPGLDQQRFDLGTFGFGADLGGEPADSPAVLEQLVQLTEAHLNAADAARVTVSVNLRSIPSRAVKSLSGLCPRPRRSQ